MSKALENAASRTTLVRSLAAAAAIAMLVANPAFAQDAQMSQPDEGWLQRQFDVEERAWVFGTEYLFPTLFNRKIDVVTLDVARAWRFSSGLEVQLRGGLAHTDGERTDSPPDGEGPDSTTTGITGGLGLRYYLIDLDRVHVFADGAIQFYWAPGQPFPSGGTAIDGFFRGGGGFSYDIAPKTAIEVTYHYAHMSNGGWPPQNPTWEGQGGSLALRFRF